MCMRADLAQALDMSLDCRGLDRREKLHVATLAKMFPNANFCANHLSNDVLARVRHDTISVRQHISQLSRKENLRVSPLVFLEPRCSYIGLRHERNIDLGTKIAHSD